MSDDQVGEFANLHAVWPGKLKGRRNYRAALLQKLSLVERGELRRLLRKRIGGGSLERQDAFARKRWAAAIIRRMDRLPGSHKRMPIPKAMLLGRKKEGAILDALHPGRRTEWTSPVKRRQHHSIKLRNFSLIDQPAASFQALHELAKLEASSAGIRVDFEDEWCLDVSAYLVLGLMSQTMIRVMGGGGITSAVRAMLNAVDLATFMGVHAPDGASDPTFSPFRLRHRRPTGTSTTKTSAFQPSRAEKLADDLVATMNSWMSLSKRPALGKTLKGYVSRLVTEVLDNAVRHSCSAAIRMDLRGDQDGHAIALGRMIVASDCRWQGPTVLRCWFWCWDQCWVCLQPLEPGLCAWWRSVGGSFRRSSR